VQSARRPEGMTELPESDLQETFARSGGPGGQNVNKVSTAVTLRHLPSGLSVTVQDSRSQATNRKLARERLRDLLERKRREHKAAERAVREKRRRQRSPRPRRLKERILESKRQRSRTKKLRSAVED
jgi:protein subunit release factor B